MMMSRTKLTFLIVFYCTILTRCGKLKDQLLLTLFLCDNDYLIVDCHSLFSSFKVWRVLKVHISYIYSLLFCSDKMAVSLRWKSLRYREMNDDAFYRILNWRKVTFLCFLNSAHFVHTTAASLFGVCAKVIQCCFMIHDDFLYTLFTALMFALTLRCE